MELEEILYKISELAQTGVAKGKELAGEGVAKAKELTEIGKLKVENAAEQEVIKKAYVEIGQLYFASRGEDPEEPYAALCEKIAAGKAKIAYNEERIADIRAAGNVKDEEAAAAYEAEVVEGEEPPADQPPADGEQNG